VPFDVIGASFYGYWHGTFAELQANLDDVTARYGKDVAVVETAYPFTLAGEDHEGQIIDLESELVAGYTATPDGQADWLRDIQTVVRAVPRGLGTFWWEATWTAVEGNGWSPPNPASGNGWENQALFGFGDSGLLPDAKLEPVREVTDVPRAHDEDALRRAVIIKLNGGLGTSMGLRGPKSLIEAKDGHTFLEIIARQARSLGRPLVLMKSFATREATVPGAAHFLQHRQPKLRADDLMPVRWPRDPALEWCPPGHGDLYAALIGSGMLDALLERGCRYAFISNADNLGAVLDPAILAWFAAERLELAMEVVAGTEADRKGGHIALRDGRLVLRETAQTPPDEVGSFRDFRRWRFYNTNNVWLDLQALADRGAPDLPLIVNRKTVDPGDPSSPAVLQLETAMGAAIGAFERVAAVRVARLSLRAGEDHQRPARPAFGRLRAGRRRPARGGRSAALRRPRPGALRAPRRLRAALPGRAAIAGRLRALRGARQRLIRRVARRGGSCRWPSSAARPRSRRSVGTCTALSGP
jgi:UTP--glucose-1-phosphate uridylyltransferase/Glycosyl hydrolase family 53